MESKIYKQKVGEKNMSTRIKFDINNNVKIPTIIICRANHEQIGKIPNRFISDIVFGDNLNDSAEFTCNIHKEVDGETFNLWDSVVDFKSIYIPEHEKYFKITVSLNDDEEEVKSISGISQSKDELSNLYIYDTEINTEKDISREDYEITVLYDGDNIGSSLLNRVLEKAVHYTIKHVDSNIANIQRTFSIDNESIYDFLTSTLSDEIGCLVEFDEIERGIYVYDMYTTCNECNYRGDYIDICPECGSSDLAYGYGEDTAIFVSKNRLGRNLTIQSQTDQIKNVFKLIPGDDIMRATVANINLGGEYIYYISDDVKKDMPSELVDRLRDYDDLVASYQDEFTSLTANMYDIIDQILYYTSGMMPTIEHEDTSATLEAAKLTQSNLSPMGLVEVRSSTSTATVNSAITKFAKIFIHSGKYKIDINQGQFTYVGTDVNGYSYGNWYGNFKLTNVSNTEDTAISEMITVKVWNNYTDFMEQKIKKSINDSDVSADSDGSIFNVLLIDELNEFKDALKLYGLNRLTSFHSSIQSVLDILLEADQASNSADLYDSMYIPYLNKLKATQTEIDVRAETIDSLNQQNENIESQRTEIKNITNMQNFLGDDLWKIFILYRRESKYENNNYISDGLDNTQLIEKAQEFLTLAKQDVYKSGNQQLSISADLNNLLVIEEFKPLVDSFECGNWIRVKVDGIAYKLRLLSYKITYDDLQTIQVEFSDVRKIVNKTDSINEILNQSQSMASTYSNYQNQASQGKEASSILTGFREVGLNSALYNITNANSTFKLDNHGLLGRSYDDITENYADEQVRLTNNIIAFTDDNWTTVRSALGKMKVEIDGVETEKYGFNADFVLAGWVQGSTIVGGILKSDNYVANSTGMYIDLRNGTVDTKNFKLASDGTVTATNGNYSGTVTTSNITATGGTIGGWTLSGSAIYRTSSAFGNVNGMYFGTSGISLSDKFRVTSAGALTATSGVMGGWNIASYGLYNDTLRAGFLSHPNSTIILYVGNTTYQGMINDINNGTDHSLPNFWVTRQGHIKGVSGSINGEFTAGNIISNSITTLGRNVLYSGDSQIVNFNHAGTYMHVTTTQGSYGVDWWSSDRRLKKNIANTKASGLNMINKIKHKEFDWNKDSPTPDKHENIGYVAQELEKINEEFIIKVPQPKDSLDPDSEIVDYRYQVNANKIIPYVTKAIQELHEEVELLKSKVK